MKGYVKIFKSLSDMNRLRIMAVLLKAGTELCICEIMDALGIAQYNVSRHVKELRGAGLLEERRAGRFVFYSVAKPRTRSHTCLFEALKAMQDEALKADYQRLRKRLALREGGTCVVGMRGGGK